MMPNRPIAIEGFRHLLSTVEIVGLGGVSMPFGGAQEAEISVLVTVGTGATDPRSATQILRVGCGQLDLLVSGSRWREGFFVGNTPAEPISGRFEFIRNELIGQGVDPPPPGQVPFPSRTIAGAPGFLLRRCSDGDRGQMRNAPTKGPELVLLPHMELLRGLFGVSSGFLLELFDGIRNPAVSGERGLVSRKTSRLSFNGTVSLEAGRNLSRDEALIAGAVIAVPAIRRLHDSAFQQLSVSRDWKQGGTTYLNLEWPWEAQIPLELEGRWIKRVDGSRFIATRILSIGVPLPFVRIEVHHPGSDMGGRDDLPSPQGRLRPANARIAVLTTGRAATAFRRPAEVGTGSVDIPSASDIEVVSIARGGGAARQDRGGIGEDPRDEAPFGTGGRQPGADAEVGLAVLKRKHVGPADPSYRSLADALDATWSALHACCRARLWELDALPRFNRASRTARHGGLDLTREPLTVLISARTQRILVVDWGSPAGDERSLGILVPRRTDMSDLELAFAARRACDGIKGRWRSRNLRAPEFNVTSINRTLEVWTDSSAYADLLGRRIAEILDR